MKLVVTNRAQYPMRIPLADGGLSIVRPGRTDVVEPVGDEGMGFIRSWAWRRLQFDCVLPDGRNLNSKKMWRAYLDEQSAPTPAVVEPEPQVEVPEPEPEPEVQDDEDTDSDVPAPVEDIPPVHADEVSEEEVEAFADEHFARDLRRMLADRGLPVKFGNKAEAARTVLEFDRSSG